MTSYRTLDPMTEGPDVTGPTRDWNQIAKRETVYRQEWGYNMKPGRRPVSLTLRERPVVTASPITQVNPGRLPVLIRKSNVNPQASGTGNGASTWGVSDPYWAHTNAGQQAVAGLGADVPSITPFSYGPSVFIYGAVAGLAAWWLWKKGTK